MRETDDDVRARQAPTGIDVDLLARLAVGNGDRRCMAPKVELSDGESMQPRVRNLDPAAMQQPANLGQANLLLDQSLDLGALGPARLPAIAVGALYARLQREHDGTDLLVGELGRACRKPRTLAGGDVATHGLDVQRQLGGDPFLLRPTHPEEEHFFDLDHRDLAVRHRRKVDGRSVTRRQGGILLRKPASVGECS
jgi:hypothetical protein